MFLARNIHKMVMPGNTQRFLHGTPAALKDYALIVSGGRPTGIIRNRLFSPFPEESQLKDVINIHKVLSANQFEVSTLFGQGPSKIDGNLEKITTVLSNTFFYRAGEYLAKYIKVLNDFPFRFIRNSSELPFITEANTYENIRNSLLHIGKKSKKNDQLYIILAGHGEKYGGISIWGETLFDNTLSLPMFSKILTEVDLKSDITLVVKSCYGGMWNLIRDEHKNIVVLCSANQEHAGYYRAGEESHYVNEFLNALSKKNSSGSLIESHAKGALLDECYYPTDSMSYQLNTRLWNQLAPTAHSFGAKYITLKTKYLNRNPIFGRFGNITATFSLAFLMARDPFGYFNSLYHLKVYGPFLIKNIILIKSLAILLSIKLYTQLENAVISTELYKQHPVKMDKPLIYFLSKQIGRRLSKQDLNNETLLYLISRRDEILEILLKTKNFSGPEWTTPVYSPYTFLASKIVLFLLNSILNNESTELIDDFIKVSSLLLNINFMPASELHKKVIQQLISVPLQETVKEMRPFLVNEQQVLNYSDPEFDFIRKDGKDDPLRNFLICLLLKAEKNNYPFPLRSQMRPIDDRGELCPRPSEKKIGVKSW